MESTRDRLKFDLYSVLQDLAHNLLYIILAGVTAALLFYTVVKVTYTPAYTTHITFAVSVRGTTNSVYNNFTTATNMSKVFEQVLTSSVLTDKVAEELGTDTLNGHLSVTQIEETNMLKLTVTASTPEQSFRIMKSVLNNYREISEPMMGNAVMEQLDKPSMPEEPENPLNMRNIMIIAAIGGMLFLTALIVLFSYLRDTVKSAEEVEEKLDGNLLGTVLYEKKQPTAKNKKTSLLITNPSVRFSFVESYRKLATKVDYQCKKHGYQVLMITSVLSNEGKSTVAANLALALAKRKKKVLLIDGDLRKPAQHLIFDYQMKEKDEMMNFLRGDAKPEDILIRNRHGIYMVCTSKGYAKSNELLLSDKMKELLQYGKENMDYVIVDTSPMALVADAEAVAEIAECSIMVVRKNFTLTRDINDAADALRSGDTPMLGYIYNAERDLTDSTEENT